MDNYFPPGNPLNKIFNRNKVKMSYRCTANFSRKISGHNAKILKLNNNNNHQVPPKNVTAGKKMSALFRVNVYKRGLCTKQQ
jgi:hypothetical protein